jgi:hypothetical protein
MAEYQELEVYCLDLERALAQADPVLFSNMPARPISKAMIEELIRVKVMGKRTLANRAYARRVRAGDAERLRDAKKAEKTMVIEPRVVIREDITGVNLSQEPGSNLSQATKDHIENMVEGERIEEEYDARKVDLPKDLKFGE